MKYARMRGLVIRKTRESLSEAALVTFEEKVLPAGSSIAEAAPQLPPSVPLPERLGDRRWRPSTSPQNHVHRV